MFIHFLPEFFLLFIIIIYLFWILNPLMFFCLNVNDTFFKNKVLYQGGNCLSLIFILFLFILYLDFFDLNCWCVNIFNMSWLLSINVIKCFVLLFFFIFMLYSEDFLKMNSFVFIEYPFFLMILLFGVLLLLFVNDFLLLYVLLEFNSLVTLSLVVLFRRSLVANEGALKYFFLNAIFSGFLLVILFSFYSLVGSLSYLNIVYFVNSFNDFNYLGLFFLLFFFLFLCFKINYYPFHFYLVDLIEATSLNVIPFFVLIIKFVLFLVFLKLFSLLNVINIDFLVLLISLVMVISIFVGVFGALYQFNLKRFVVFASLNQMSFIVFLFIDVDFLNYSNVFFYIFVYVFVISLFFMFLFLNRTKRNFYELKGFVSYSILISFFFFLNVISIAGIPPFLGFYSKYLALIGMISIGLKFFFYFVVSLSLVATLYYLRIGKHLFFNSLNNNVYCSRDIVWMDKNLVLFFIYFFFLSLIFVFEVDFLLLLSEFIVLFSFL